ncbi:MAG: hypothetical protein QM770_16110 [Tepidisphaeraceae bacterium]
MKSESIGQASPVLNYRSATADRSLSRRSVSSHLFWLVVGASMLGFGAMLLFLALIGLCRVIIASEFIWLFVMVYLLLIGWLFVYGGYRLVGNGIADLRGAQREG